MAARLPTRRATTMMGCVALLGMPVGDAWAQAGAQGGVAPPTIWIEPSVSAGATLSSNGNVSGGNTRSELVLDITPGVSAVFNTPRIRGFVDYSLSAQYYVDGNSANRLSNRLSANATVEAWAQRAFVDVSGSISDQAISAFGPQTLTGLSDTNRSETSTFRVSPYVRGSFGGLMDYQLRYSLQSSNSDASAISDSSSQSLSARIGSRPMGQPVGWYLDASTQETSYTARRDIRSDVARAGVIFAVSPQLNVTLSAGVETNDTLTPERESYDITGVAVDWRPSQRTSLSASAENRYFGTGYNVALEHRTGRTVWRYMAERSASDSAQAGSFSRGSIYDLLDALAESIEPDPVLRAQLVQAQLLQLGLPPDAQVFQDFLSSSATLNRTQQFSVALSGIRSVVTFNITLGSTRRLSTLSTLGDDFDTNDEIDQKSWGVNYGHRLSPVSTLSASYVNSNSDGSSGASSKRQSVSLGLSTRLAPRTSGSVQLQFGRFNNTAGSYNDAAISGRITHRF